MTTATLLLLAALPIGCGDKDEASDTHDHGTGDDDTGDDGTGDDTGHTGDTEAPPEHTGDTGPAGHTGTPDRGDTDTGEAPSPTYEEMSAFVEASLAFLASLDADQLDLVSFDMSDSERRTWSNLPVPITPREGLSLGELTEAQLALARAVIEAGTSAAGYQDFTDVLIADTVMEEGGDPYSGNGYYHLGFFDTPSMDTPWGFQFDGHHFVLNYTCWGEQMTLAPAFYGSSPVNIEVGEHAGLTVLEAEVDRAWDLYETLSEDQLAQALLPGPLPSDVYAGPGDKDVLTEYEGVQASALTEDQQALLLNLAEAYLGTIPDALAAARMAELEDTLDETWFAWQDGTERGDRIYYRIHGPRLLIEFLHPGTTEHIHAVVRDPADDYGDLLLGKTAAAMTPPPPAGPAAALPVWELYAELAAERAGAR